MFRNWKANNAKRKDFSGEIIQIPKSKDGYLRQQKDNPAFLEGKSWQDGEPTLDNPAPINSIPHDTGIVSCGENLFNKQNNFTTNGTVTIINDEVVECKGNAVDAIVSSFDRGWYRPGYNISAWHRNQFKFKTGDKVTISADVKLTELVYENDLRMFISTQLPNNLIVSGNRGPLPLNEWERVNSTFTITQEMSNNNTWYPVFTLNGNRVQFRNIKVELGDTATPYTPYQGTTTHLSLIGAPNAGEWAGKEIDLMGLPDGTADYYDQDRQVVVKKVKQEVFDGTENWTIVPSYETATRICLMGNTPSNYTFLQSYMTSIDHYRNTHFTKSLTRLGTNLADNICRLTDRFYATISKTLATDVATFKNWLSSNPVTIQYPLATPYEIPVITQPKIITVDDTIGTVYNLDGAKMNINAISYGG